MCQSLFQLMERWGSLPEWDLNYVFSERIDWGQADSWDHHVHHKPSLKFICTFQSFISFHAVSFLLFFLLIRHSDGLHRVVQVR